MNVQAMPGGIYVFLKGLIYGLGTLGLWEP